LKLHVSHHPEARSRLALAEAGTMIPATSCRNAYELRQFPAGSYGSTGDTMSVALMIQNYFGVSNNVNQQH
jgi:hypothetical protein